MPLLFKTIPDFQISSAKNIVTVLVHPHPHISSYGIKTNTPRRRNMLHIPQQILFFDAIYHISYLICHTTYISYISSYGIKTSPRTSPITPSRRNMLHIPQQIRFFDARTEPFLSENLRWTNTKELTSVSWTPCCSSSQHFIKKICETICFLILRQIINMCLKSSTLEDRYNAIEMNTKKPKKRLQMNQDKRGKLNKSIELTPVSVVSVGSAVRRSEPL